MPKNLAALLDQTTALIDEAVVRSGLGRYLRNEQSLRVFWRWFVPATWHVDHRSPPRLRQLVYSIKLRVDDYSNGGISEVQLRGALRPLVTNTVFRGKQAIMRKTLDWSPRSARGQQAPAETARLLATARE